MDPYIEMDQWQEFHVNMIVEIQRQLVPQLLPKYVARVERRVYTEHLFDEVEVYQPDVEIVRATSKVRRPAHSAAAVAELEPRMYAAPAPHERSEPFLKIIDRSSGQLIALIEFLSPTNKAPGSDGCHAYHEKRDETLRSQTHLVEIDLLRSGTRLPTIEPLDPTTDYCVFLHRAPRRFRSPRRFQVEVYEWPLRHTLPPIPIPLAASEADARLDLQRTFSSVYDGAGYAAFVNYDVTLRPPLRKADASWARQMLSRRT
jgi:hypothetical protein